MNDTQMKSLQLAMLNIEKQFGKNAVFMGDIIPEEVDVIPTGNFKLDLALGVGGLPKGRVVEIFGPEGLGKTLLGLTTAGECQRSGGVVAYVDAECDFDGRWATVCGCDIDTMIISQPEYGEQALDIVIALAKSGAVDMIVVDSVAALVPKAELDGEMLDNFMGLQARMMGQALRKMRQIVKDNNVLLVFINQVRDKLGPVPGTTTPGGRALKFAASVRLEIKKVQALKDAKTGEFTGFRVKVTTIKNKVANPMRTIEYDIIHGKGFNNNGAIVEMAEKFGFIKKSGSWYTRVDLETGEVGDKAFAQGLDNVVEYMVANPEWATALENKIRGHVKGIKEY